MRVQKPYWPRNLRLLPQHLQARDGHIELRLAHHLKAVEPFLFGLLSGGVDETELAQGTVRLRDVTAILPSGEWVACGATVGRPLGELLREDVASVDLYLSVRSGSGDGLRVALGERTDVAGRVRAKHKVPSAETGASVTVQWIESLPRLVRNTEFADGEERLFVARLRRDGRGVRVDPLAVPPSPRLVLSPFLRGGLADVIRRAEETQRALSGRRTWTPQQPERFHESDILLTLMLTAINRWLPRLRDLSVRNGAHPWEAYSVLVQMVGALRAVDWQAFEQPVPAFDYLQMGSVFSPLFEELNRLLRIPVALAIETIVLEPVDGSHRKGRVLRRQLSKELLLGARGGAQADLLEQIPMLSKIAGPVEIANIGNSAVSGVPLRVEYNPPAVLPRERGVVFFRLDQSVTFWEEIVKDECLVLQVPESLKDVSFVLYVCG